MNTPFENLTKELQEEATKKIKWYKDNKSGVENWMTDMMLNEVEMQYIEMANGGDGTIAMMGNIREKYYEGKPDAFFQHVCDGMGWEWRN